MFNRSRVSGEVARKLGLAVAVGVMTLSATSGRAETPAYWVGPVSGTWTDGSKWSTAPQYPADGNGTPYNAVFQATGAAYTVDTGTNAVSVEHVTVDSADATLVANGVFAPRRLDVSNGVFRLAGGTLSGARVTVTGGGKFQLGTPTGVLENVTVASDLVLDQGQVNVRGGLTLESGATVRLGQFPSPFSDPTLSFTSGSTLAGQGAIELVGSRSVLAAVGGVATIGSGITIRPAIGATHGTVTWNATGRFANYGTILADRAGFSLDVTSLGSNAFENRGTLRASAGTLTLGRVLNWGTVHVSNATLNLAELYDPDGTGTLILDHATTLIGTSGSWGSISTSSLERMVRTGGYLSVYATIDNAGHVFDPARYGFDWLQGKLVGGTLSLADPDYGVGLELSNVTLASNLNVHGVLKASGDLTFAGSQITFSGLTQGLTAGNLRGQGRLVFDKPTSAVLAAGSVIDPGVELVVRDGNLALQDPVAPSAFANRGTITVSAGRALAIYGDQWSNQGVIDLGEGSALHLGGVANLPADVGMVNRSVGSVVVWAPTINAAGTSIDLNVGPLGPMELGAATLTGVTVTAPGRTLKVYGPPILTGKMSKWTGVTVGADLDFEVGAGFEVGGGLTLAGRNVRFTDATNSLNFSTTGQTLGGTGEVVFDAVSGTDFSAGNYTGSKLIAGGTLTIAAGVTLRTGTGDGAVGKPFNGGASQLVNNGTISARGAGRLIAIESTLVNNGTIEAVDGGVIGIVAPFTNAGTMRVVDSTLRIGGSLNADALGQFSASNATVEIVGAFDNAGRTVDVRDAARGITLSLGGRGSIKGGTVTSADGTPLRVVRAPKQGSEIDAAVAAPVVVAPQAVLSVSGTGRLSGGVTVGEGAWVTLNGAKDYAPAIDARAGSSVWLYGPLPSLANVKVDGATVSLLGTGWTTAGVRQMAASNSVVELRTDVPVDNAGQTIVVDDDGLRWRLAGGAIIGGRVEARSASSFLTTDGGGVLKDVTMAVSLQGSGPVTVVGALTMEPNHGVPTSLSSSFGFSFGTGSVATIPGMILGAGTNSVTLVGGNARVAAGGISQSAVSMSTGGRLALAPAAAGGRVSHINQLTLSSSTADGFRAAVDVADVPLIVDRGSGLLATVGVRQAIAQGYARGAWTGLGITSSYAAAHPGTALGFATAAELLGIGGTQTATLLGETVSPGATLIRLTRAGDATLDGVVNFDDLLRLAKNYGQTPAGSPWYAGDFDYNGSVNFDDLLLLAKNYNGAMPGGPWVANSPAASFQADVAAAFAEAAVPEPTALAGAALVGGLVAARRGRRRA